MNPSVADTERYSLIYEATDEVNGSNRYCGIFGYFKMLKLGYANLYVTKIGKCILVEKLNGEKYIISPEILKYFSE